MGSGMIQHFILFKWCLSGCVSPHMLKKLQHGGEHSNEERLGLAAVQAMLIQKCCETGLRMRAAPYCLRLRVTTSERLSPS